MGPFLRRQLRDGGAALTANVDHLVLYEPSLGLAYPAGSIESIEQKVAAGDAEAALLEVLVDIAGMTEEEVEAMRSNPKMPWEARLATVPTVPREVFEETGLRLSAAPSLLGTHEHPDGLGRPSRTYFFKVIAPSVRLTRGSTESPAKATTTTWSFSAGLILRRRYGRYRRYIAPAASSVQPSDQRRRQGTFPDTGARRAFVSGADLAFCWAAFVAVLHDFAALRGLAAAYGVARHGSAIC